MGGASRATQRAASAYRQFHWVESSPSPAAFVAGQAARRLVPGSPRLFVGHCESATAEPWRQPAGSLIVQTSGQASISSVSSGRLYNLWGRRRGQPRTYCIEPSPIGPAESQNGCRDGAGRRGMSRSTPKPVPDMYFGALTHIIITRDHPPRPPVTYPRGPS